MRASEAIRNDLLVWTQVYVARPESPDIANGAPVRGAVAWTRRAGLPSVHLHCRGRRTMVCAPFLEIWRYCGHYSPATARLPRLVARGYPAAVYGPAVRDSFLLGFRRFEKTAARSIRYLNRSRQFHVTASRSVAAVLPISGRTGREHSTPVRRNVNSGHLRARATRRSERSGFTTCGWPTSSRSGRSVT